MTISTKYNLGDHVRIPGLNVEGRVFAIFFAGRVIEYRVRFASNGDFKEGFFWEDEVELKRDVPCGFRTAEDEL